MALSTKTTIVIDGETMTRFTELTIEQNANAHHTFSITQPIPKEFVNQAIDKSQDYVGKTIRIEIESNNLQTNEPLIFNGIITQANLMRKNGAVGQIHINGYSPTIALEGQPNTKSYTNKTPTDITQEILQDYTRIQLRPTINYNNNPTMPYTVQYGESDFAFLRRIAQKKGEWMYYNGEELICGKPKSNTITLEYGRTLHSFNIEMNAKPLKFEYTGYDPSSSETQTANTTEINYQVTGISKQMLDASNKLYQKPGNTQYNNPIEENNTFRHLNERITTQMQAQASSLIIAKGESDETGLRIGDIIIINESGFSATGNPQDAVKEHNYGSYIITKLNHSCQEIGQYKNTFEAIPETAKTPPYGDVFSTPTAVTQPAKITNNNDPKGLGRVQVQMEWQRNNSENTPWIRMTNPHAGGGKGMYFIPEIGEEVLVGFEGNNAEKPFVLGAMYHGNQSSNYSTAGNDQKVIQTRSGCKILINDAIGSIFLEDPSGNTVLMDGKGNINFNAPKNFTLNAGENINMTAGKDVTVSAGENMSNSAGKDISQTAGHDINQMATGEMRESTNNKTEIIQDKFVRGSGNSTEFAEKVTLFSTKENMHIESLEKTVNINSAERTNLF